MLSAGMSKHVEFGILRFLTFVFTKPEFNDVLKHFPALAAGPMPDSLKLLNDVSFDFGVELGSIVTCPWCGHSLVITQM